MLNNIYRIDPLFSGVNHYQCDQIGRFSALWAAFQSLWQQLLCPNSPHFRQIL